MAKAFCLRANSPRNEAAPKTVDGMVATLFATETCPNCRIACNYLDKAGYPYQKLYVSENADLAKSLGVKQAPTLVLPDGTKLAGAGAIKGFLTKTA